MSIKGQAPKIKMKEWKELVIDFKDFRENVISMIEELNGDLQRLEHAIRELEME